MKMAAIIKLSIVVFAMNLVFISPAYAVLSDITVAELLDAVKQGDSLHRNIDCKYTVDEQHDKSIWAESGIPLNRKLEIHWRREGINDYLDVTNHNGRLVLGKPVRFVQAYNGKIRMQWIPNQNNGTIFNKPFVHNWALPIDFGFTLADRNKKLGESLDDCRITSIRQKKWQGHECYFVQADFTNGSKAEVWIDPEIGWRARHLRIYGPDGSIERDSSAVFKDWGRGTWFPVKGTFRSYGNDRSSGEHVVSIEKRLKVEQVTVNAKLTIKDFEVEYPLGTRVLIYDTGETYIAGVTPVADSVEDESNPLQDKPLPDIKQFAVADDPNQTKDKTILVCFFDMDERSSKNCMRQLSAKAQELKAKGVFIAAVHASNVDENKLRLWLQKYRIDFPAGMFKTDAAKTRDDWGISFLPWLILTDEEHIVTDVGFSPAELDDMLNRNSD
jgi:hypothetical protein